MNTNIFSLVDAPLIEYIFDQADGREYEAGEYIANADSATIAKIRDRVYENRLTGEPNIVCAGCYNPAYPRKNYDTGKYHFAHVRDENRNCPYWEKKKNIYEINSRRYNGQKEGPEHRKLKLLLEESIKADPNFDSDIKVEKNWYSLSDPTKWRRPDIAAVRKHHSKEIKIAFEIQLSSTFLKDIVARRRFYYLEDNALLFWIFNEASSVDPRQYQEDLFYNNNNNLFIVNETTLSLSKEQGRLVFQCRYTVPVLKKGKIIDEWEEAYVGFDELSINLNRQQVYYFDYDRVREQLDEDVKKIKLENLKNVLTNEYWDFWLRYSKENRDYDPIEYANLKSEFINFGISLPKYPQNFYRFNWALLSAKNGYPTLTKFKTLLEVANSVEDQEKDLLWYFGKVLVQFGNFKKLEELDLNASKNKYGRAYIFWRQKLKKIKEVMLTNPRDYRNPEYESLFIFLFPEVPKFENAMEANKSSAS